jgi:hypothetical protein
MTEPVAPWISHYSVEAIMRGTRLAHLLVRISVTAVLAMTATAASAQGTAPRLVASFGAGSMDPIHADEYREGPVLIGSLGFAATRRWHVEAEVTRRAHARAETQDNIVLPYTGATGVPGRADRQVFGTETSDWTAGVNLIARTAPRMVSLFGGGGAVLHQEHERAYRTLTNCTPPSPSGPFNASCLEFDRRSVKTDAGLQGLAGADIRLAPRLQAYVAVRYEIRPDLGMGSFGFAGGVRFAIR